MYGYATVSYIEILDRMKFWPVQTAVKTAAFKVKKILGNLRWTEFCLKQLWIVCTNADR